MSLSSVAAESSRDSDLSRTRRLHFMVSQSTSADSKQSTMPLNMFSLTRGFTTHAQQLSTAAFPILRRTMRTRIVVSIPTATSSSFIRWNSSSAQSVRREEPAAPNPHVRNLHQYMSLKKRQWYLTLPHGREISTSNSDGRLQRSFWRLYLLINLSISSGLS